MHKQPDYANIAAWAIIAFFFILTLALNDPCSDWAAKQGTDPAQCE